MFVCLFFVLAHSRLYVGCFQVSGLFWNPTLSQSFSGVRSACCSLCES